MADLSTSIRTNSVVKMNRDERPAYGCDMRSDMAVITHPPFLGFLKGETIGSVEDGRRILIEKGDGLTTVTPALEAPPHLGFFEGSSSSINGRRESGESWFNIDEFICLTYKVIDDGDTASLDALAKLKTRWEARFGNGGNIAPVPFEACRCLFIFPVGVFLSRRLKT
ncbi:UNVERIFIED_CONTAM: hypothetical protein Sindi_1274400 [Sesamum indicum]